MGSFASSGFSTDSFSVDAFYFDEVIPEFVFSLPYGGGRGWDKKAWKKRKTQEDALEQTILETYKKVLGVEPTKTFVVKAKKEIKSQVVETKREFEDYFQVISWLQTYQMFIDRYINEVKLKQEMDDEEAILLLM